jgi:streptomycin 6-kinase
LNPFGGYSPLKVPQIAGLAHWRSRPGGEEWLAALPRLAAECAEQWDLRLEPPFEPATVSLVIPAGDAVLKINFPDEESEREADALAHWQGDGAVRLLAHDPERRALLVERCRPGVQLWSIEEEAANHAAADLLRRLWRPAAPEHRFRALTNAARDWAASLPALWERHDRPCDRGLLERAVAFLTEAEQGECVVLHQDLHGGNILQAKEDWLAIDPKPLTGEPAFDLASLLRDRRADVTKARIRRRLDLLTAETGVDRERVREWGIGHALAWGLERDRAHAMHLACAQWLAQA